MQSNSNATRVAEIQRWLSAAPAALVDRLTRFIADETRRAGFERLLVGLSGGLDSSLAAALAVRACGAAAVRGVLMPCGALGARAVEDARLVTAWLGIEAELVDIEPMVEAYFASFPSADRVRRGNLMARQRMAVLYDLSMRDTALVTGTSNKSELLLGYGTLHGDIASALNPLGDLYKTQVRTLGRHLEIPRGILDKPPTADLWPGQSDEEELGFTYEAVDPLLHLLVDRRLDHAEIVEYGFELDFVERVAERIRSMAFKRRLPLIAELSADFQGGDRYPAGGRGE